MRESRFQLATGDRNVGVYYLPDVQQGVLPVLILCHGWPGDRTLNPFGEELVARGTEAGLAVVNFDFFSSGETGGDPHGMSDGRWAANLADVCTYVAGQAWADPGRIGAIGISSGSTAVLRCMIAGPHLALGIVVATCLGHYIGMGKVGPAKLFVDNLDALLAGQTIDFYGYPCGLEYFKDYIGGAPVYQLRTITRPVLFLQGGADNVFRRTDALLGYRMMVEQGLPADYHEIVEGDHGLGNVPVEATAAVLDWLRAQTFLR